MINDRARERANGSKGASASRATRSEADRRQRVNRGRRSCARVCVMQNKVQLRNQVAALASQRSSCVVRICMQELQIAGKAPHDSKASRPCSGWAGATLRFCCSDWPPPASTATLRTHPSPPARDDHLSSSWWARLSVFVCEQANFSLVQCEHGAQVASAINHEQQRRRRRPKIQLSPDCSPTCASSSSVSLGSGSSSGAARVSPLAYARA